MGGAQSICIVIIRLCAVAFILTSLSNFISLSAIQSNDEAGRRYLFSYMLIGVVWFSAGVFGWILAPRLARAATSKLENNGINVSFGSFEFVQAGSFVIGLFLLAENLPWFIGRLARHYYQMTSSTLAYEDRLTPADLGDTVGNLLILIIAIFFAFRPSDIARLFSALRVAGLSKVESKD